MPPSSTLPPCHLRRALAVLALVGWALAACESHMNVTATANVAASYTHVWLTVSQVWVNASATAAPSDTGWLKFPLATPATVDLVQATNGALSQLATALKVPTGTYGQLRIFLRDPADTLTASAKSVNALYNDEVDYFDSSGTEHQVPLRLANPEQGISVVAALKVPDAATQVLAEVAGSAATGTTTGTTGTTTATGTTGTSTTGTGTTTSTGTTRTAIALVAGSAAVDFDATRDLVPFNFSGQLAFLLNPHPTGHDLGDVGTIQGQVAVAALIGAGTTRPQIEVAAESLSADATRHVVVKRASVRSDGTFVLYPFSVASGAPASFDLVIHGPGVGTVIVKSVPVRTGTPSSAATVALGTITLAAAPSFSVNIATSGAIAPRGASVGLYQTLPASGEVPYLIEERPVDPLSGLLAQDQPVSAGELGFTTFASAGTPALAAATPAEGAATYAVSVSAPFFGDAAFGVTVAAPAAGVTTTQTFTPGGAVLPATAAADSIGAVLSIAAPGKYDRGALLITHGGTIITALPLDASLASSAAPVTLSGVPGGTAALTFDAALYYADVWVWNSGDPAGTFSRQPQPAVIDLRGGSVAGLGITIQ